jgi:hypothetical protein
VETDNFDEINHRDGSLPVLDECCSRVNKLAATEMHASKMKRNKEQKKRKITAR